MFILLFNISIIIKIILITKLVIWGNLLNSKCHSLREKMKHIIESVRNILFIITRLRFHCVYLIKKDSSILNILSRLERYFYLYLPNKFIAIMVF